MTVDFELKPHATVPKADKPVLVCILDGWGENVNQDQWNAIHVASTPTTDGLKKNTSRWRTVQAHGTAVGLPSDADMGNSGKATCLTGSSFPAYQRVSSWWPRVLTISDCACRGRP